MLVFILFPGAMARFLPPGYLVQFRGTRAIAAPRMLPGFSKQPDFISRKVRDDEAR